MKNWLIAFSLLVFLSSNTQAQEHKPELLPEPANWQFERFLLPPTFAPGISYKGAEELRFSPGMFSKDSTNYFTYAFVAQLDNVTAISKSAVKDYLLKYFKGLCIVTAKDHKLTIDSSKITAALKKKKGIPSVETIYNATLNMFGVFTDGAPVKLNMELKVVINRAAKKTYLVIIASPRRKDDIVWTELYAIQKRFVVPE